MAITLVSSQENALTAPTSPATVSINVGTRTNGLLKVDCVGTASNVISAMTATYAGASMNASSRAENVFSSPARLFAVTFYLAPPTDGTNDFVLTFTIDSGGSISELYVLSSWWDGVYQGTALDQQASGSGSTDPSASVTPTENNELVAGTHYSRANSVLTVGADETLLQNHDFGANVAGGSYVIQTTAGAQTVDFTGADDQWVMIVTSFKQYAAAAAASLALHRKGRYMAGLLAR